MHAQPSSEHFASLEACFLCSEIWADPAVTHVSLRVIGFSSDVTVRSKATGFPRSQFGTRTSADPLCVHHASNHFLPPFDHQHQPACKTHTRHPKSVVTPSLHCIYKSGHGDLKDSMNGLDKMGIYSPKTINA